MKNRNLVISSLLLAVGLILHAITPGFFALMKPDFLCAMFFISLTLVETYQEMMVISILCAFLSAATTTIPGGQIANIVDKLLCGPIIFTLIQNIKHFKLFNKTVLIAGFGTILSGVLFLGTLTSIGQLPLSFFNMLTAVVLPTAIANSLLFYILLKTLMKKRSSH